MIPEPMERKYVWMLVVVGVLFGITACRSTAGGKEDSFQEARRILDSVGIRTNGIHWDARDSSIEILLDTSSGHLDSMNRWSPRPEDRKRHFPSSIGPPDCSPLKRIVEHLGAREVRIVAMVPSSVTEYSDGRREVGPIRPWQKFQFSFDRAKRRITNAKFDGIWEISELVDPAEWTEIDRVAAGLREVEAKPLDVSSLDSSLARWLGEVDHGSWKHLPVGAFLSGRTLILDSTFAQPWFKRLRVADSSNRIREVLGKPTFDHQGIAFYKASGFYVGLAKEGFVLLAWAPSSQNRPDDLLPRLVLALRKRSPIDSIPFWSQIDTSDDGTVEYQGEQGLRVRIVAAKDSAVVFVHSDAHGRLIDPDPVRRRVWIRYQNTDHIVDRMAEDFSAWQASLQTDGTMRTNLSGSLQLEFNNLQGSRRGYILRDVHQGSPECHILLRNRWLELIGEDRYRESGGESTVEGSVDQLWERCR